MADTIKHTPLPWTQYCGGDQIYGGDKYFIGVVQSKNAKDDAAFIVKACNAYSDLLEALHAVGMSAGWQHMTTETRSLVQAAIDKAEAI